MNTPSHLIINAAIQKAAGPGRIRRSAFLLGAVLPDIPLWLLWMGSYGYYRYVAADPTMTLMDGRLDALYFTNPIWIAGHNMLHAPLLLLGAITLLWRFRAAPDSRGGWWLWFFAGCLVHTALDIPTHVNDGPLVFFPLNWSYRFQSVVSYWDPRHYGREFGMFELALDVVLLGYLLLPWLWRRLRRPGPDAAPEPKP